MPILNKVYRFRLCPTQAQGEGFVRMAGCKRWVYNWALARRKEHYELHGATLSYFEQAGELTALKKLEGTSWLKEADSQLLQQSLKDVERAYKNFFEKRAKFPRFKSKHRDPLSFRIPQRVRAAENRLYVPKIGWVKFRKSQDVEGKTKSATFKQQADGNWYVSLVVEFEMPDVPLAPARAEYVVGIDLGLKDFMTLSSGDKLPAPKFFRKGERAIRRASKAVSRSKRGSGRSCKAKQALAKVHRKVANQRQDFIHKTTTGLVKTFDGLCIEDLCVKGLVKTKLGKSVSDAAFGETRRQLEYKTVWYRRHLAVIDRWFPSSKLCRACGSINKDLKLSDRMWICDCGTVHDRDHNAAENIKAEGLKAIPVAMGHIETLNARGEGVKPACLGSFR